MTTAAARYIWHLTPNLSEKVALCGCTDVTAKPWDAFLPMRSFLNSYHPDPPYKHRPQDTWCEACVNHESIPLLTLNAVDL